MENYLDRRYKGENYTIGRFSAADTWFCDTLEPTVRPLGTPKIYGKTAIPAGRYEIEFKYSPTFKRKMPTLKDVPGFTDVLIHWGNTPKDTKGCILLGKNTVKGEVLESKITFEKLNSKLISAWQNGERLWITIK